MSETSSALPLSGLFVVELGTSIAVPFGAFVLADLGAEVLKIERPGKGDDARSWGPPFFQGASPMFRAINRNKQSAMVDLKDKRQSEALRALIVERADIVLQNLRPGVVESCGLDAKSLRREKPTLIYCNLSAYGASGPLRDKPGYDPLMQACGGIMSVTGDAGRDPVRVGPSIVDQGAGMWAVIGILAALNRRHQTGEGCEIGGSLYETAVSWCGMHIATYNTTGKLPQPMGTENFGIAPYKAYQAQDGWLVIAAGNDALFARLAPALGKPEWADDPEFRSNSERVKHRERLNRLIGDVIATDRREAWRAKLDAAGVPAAPLQTLDEVVAHPQTIAVEMVQKAPGDHPALVGLPLQFDGMRPPLRALPPELGAQTDRVLGATAKKAAS
jgi:crotonobetainyl-CoA:carnitine CoA-transferase CaiB-like acyl-CoA transferase